MRGEICSEHQDLQLFNENKEYYFETDSSVFIPHTSYLSPHTSFFIPQSSYLLLHTSVLISINLPFEFTRNLRFFRAI
jgi:hypothetical protein